MTLETTHKKKLGFESMAQKMVFWWGWCMLSLPAWSFGQNFNPGEVAPNFTLPTLRGPLIYKGLKSTQTNIRPPIIFHEYTNHSGFLEALWTKTSSLLELIDNSPENTQYVFLTSANDAQATAEWMQKRFKKMLEKYFQLARNLSTSVTKSEIGQANQWRHNNHIPDYILGDRTYDRGAKRSKAFPMPKRRISRRSLPTETVVMRQLSILKHSQISLQHKPWSWKAYENHRGSIERDGNYENISLAASDGKYNVYRYDNQGSKRSAIYRYAKDVEENDGEEISDTTALEERVAKILSKGKEKFVEDWMDRLHFVTVPLYEVGNWIPLVMSRWYCSGHGCGLDQISVERQKDGDILFVAKRLDARYDWLPSPYTLKGKLPKPKLVSLGDGCPSHNTSLNASGMIALVSREGSCSFYQKMRTAQSKEALAVLVYTTSNDSLTDMTCEGSECEKEMKIPGAMISYGTGRKLLEILEKSPDVYIRFQHTPSRNFFLAIDEQGKLQEVGWLLYPSMIFLAYQAKWLNYMTRLLHNVTSMEGKVLNVFNFTIMQGSKGVVKSLKVPSLAELQQYKNIYLDMSLSCPGSTDYTCPHWDHTVQLYLCCSKSKPLCGKEIGRWITPFRRRIGRWLTNISPLMPMFTSTKCKFTMKTVPWEMPWKPALQLRLADRIHTNTSAPYQVVSLFRGGKFDKTYNEKRKPYSFTVPSQTTRVKLYATITGHGSDNNNCAEFCVTSHHFVVNGKFNNTRVFDKAGTASGCADVVSDGSEPNEHGTWLYGRDGWCDGQNVSPWVEDITSQVDMKPGTTNTIRYYGHFNRTDPNPTANPGYIIMYSYLVFYKEVSPK